jgi:tetratricopeptide (TPR) repeat protein
MPARYTLSNYRRQRIKDAVTTGAVRILLVALPKIVPLMDSTGSPRNQRIQDFREKMDVKKALLRDIDAGKLTAGEVNDRLAGLMDPESRAEHEASLAPVRAIGQECEELKRITIEAGDDKAMAAEGYREYLTAHPDSHLGYSFLAGALQATGNLDDNLTAYREAIRLAGSLSLPGLLARVRLGLALSAKGEKGMAIAEFRGVIDDTGPGHEVVISLAYLSLGDALLGIGSRREARTALKQAIKWDSTGALADKARTLLAEHG